ncbi:helix-turn-helix domain-containing protein [Streptomyces canus]|uniref:helix-turn-helix domain-containing protein n=1 Tax=Streptomyces canus TaxID=58343 RepID=UPI003CEF5E6D
MPAPLTIAARRAMVEELMRQEPGISARNIAARLGVGKDTIRRDIAELETAQRQAAPASAAADPQRAPHTPQGATEGAPDDRIVLILDAPLRQALAVLRATVGAPDTPEQNQAAARAAIRSVADTVLEAQRHNQEGATP